MLGMAGSDASSECDSAARVLVVADSHLSERNPEAGRNWSAVVAHVDAVAPDLVIHVGDITADGAHHPEDLDHARDQLARIEAPVHVLPGDHDLGDNPFGAPHDGCHRCHPPRSLPPGVRCRPVVRRGRGVAPPRHRHPAVRQRPRGRRRAVGVVGGAARRPPPTAHPPRAVPAQAGDRARSVARRHPLARSIRAAAHPTPAVLPDPSPPGRAGRVGPPPSGSVDRRRRRDPGVGALHLGGAAGDVPAEPRRRALRPAVAGAGRRRFVHSGLRRARGPVPADGRRPPARTAEPGSASSDAAARVGGQGRPPAALPIMPSPSRRAPMPSWVSAISWPRSAGSASWSSQQKAPTDGGTCEDSRTPRGSHGGREVSSG